MRIPQQARTSPAYIPLFWWIVSTSAVASVLLTIYVIPPTASKGNPLLAYDGRVYCTIVESGYSHTEGHQSLTSFFPLYPLTASALTALGVHTETALLITANACHAIALVFLYYYMRCRNYHCDMPCKPGTSLGVAHADKYTTSPSLTVAVTAVWPTSLFFSLLYSEAMFLALSISTLHYLQNRRLLVRAAVLSGLATACRPVGIILALACIFLAARRGLRLHRILGIALVSVSGLLAYMLFLLLKFGDPLAFVDSQLNTRVLAEKDSGLFDSILTALACEPIFGILNPHSPECWTYYAPVCVFASWQLANGIFFILSICALAYGFRRGLLTALEGGIGFGLALMPYLLRSADMCMRSQARYVLVAFPVYIVIAHAISGLNSFARFFILSSLLIMLCGYTWLLRCGYVVY